MAGIGKTTLAKGFLHWLYDTNGLAQALPNGGVFWFSFEAIRNAEYVINDLVDALFGTNARAASLEQKLTALVQALRDQPFLLVWDNFESASGIADTEVTALLNDDDRSLLKKLLKQLRGGKTKVLITSRSPENWLTPQECYRLPLFGLQGEELWEYCNAVVADLGLKIDRKHQDFIALIKELDGHPLAIRAILLRLTNAKPPTCSSNSNSSLKGRKATTAPAGFLPPWAFSTKACRKRLRPSCNWSGCINSLCNWGISNICCKMRAICPTCSRLPIASQCWKLLEAASLGARHLPDVSYLAPLSKC